jgi:hypothetical protein
VKIKPGITDILWMATGAVLLLAIMLVVLHFHSNQSPDEQLAAKARRLDLVERMRIHLSSAAEAEKSAVMAITDKDSQTYADEARAATAQVEQGRKEIVELLVAGGTAAEKDSLAQFVKAFTEFQHIDNDLLALAVSNTNLKAYSLAFGPAADALNEMDKALSHLVADNAAAPDAHNIALLAFGAQTAALRIQALLAPHIAEENDRKMDELEAQMTRHDQEVRKDLDGLAPLVKPGEAHDLETAVSSYARFSGIRTQILVLSRENTNVRSLAMSLNEKRKVTLSCQDALSALQQAIEAEPVAGANYRLPTSPRQM